MRAFVIMANDYPQGIHIGDEESAEKEKQRLAAEHRANTTPVYWRCYEFAPSGDKLLGDITLRCDGGWAEVWANIDGQNVQLIRSFCDDTLVDHTITPQGVKEATRKAEALAPDHPDLRFVVDMAVDGSWSAHCADEGIVSQGESPSDIAPQLEDAVRTHFGPGLLAFEPHRIHVVITSPLSNWVSAEARDYQAEIGQLHQTIDALEEKQAEKPVDSKASIEDRDRPGNLFWECLLHNKEKGEQLASLLTFIRDNYGPRTDADELCKTFSEDLVEVVWFECLALPDSPKQPMRISERGLKVLEKLTQRSQSATVPGGPSLGDSVASVVCAALEKHVVEQDERSRLAAQIAKRLTVPQPARELDEWAQWDGTDGAHPSWWRGQDDGVRGATERVQHALDVDLHKRQSGTMGYAPLQAVFDQVLRLRRYNLYLRTLLGSHGIPMDASLPDDVPLEGILENARKQGWSLAEELRSLRAFKRSVDDALNSGDGAYRP